MVKFKDLTDAQQRAVSSVMEQINVYTAAVTKSQNGAAEMDDLRSLLDHLRPAGGAERDQAVATVLAEVGKYGELAAAYLGNDDDDDDGQDMSEQWKALQRMAAEYVAGQVPRGVTEELESARL